ncbi:MAG: SCP2 sterol-binding domain-containing protein [Nannocystaceae bacterium]
MRLEDFTSKVRDRVGQDSGLDVTVKFVLAQGGVIHVDTKSRPHVVTNDDRAAQCTVALNAQTLTELIDGSTHPSAAYTAGDLVITGDTSVSLKLGRLLS